MIILDVNKVNKSYGFGPLLKNISFSINEGERVAIVGDNGSGKSTLLKMIARIEKIDSGTVSIKKDAVVEYLEQGDVADSKTGKCIDILKSAFTKLNSMQEELAILEEQLNHSIGEELEVLVKRYSSLQEKFMLAGGYDIDTNIDIVVSGLRIDPQVLERDFATLSGGERTLINMAKILLSKPDLLLLDEPTNHLDMSRLEWLEGYLKSYKGTVMVVSHDRYFLDRVAKKIIEINEGEAKIYVGNYSDYLRQKENEEVKQFEIYKVQQKKMDEMEKAIKRLKEWGMLSNNPMFFRRAKAIQTNLDRLRDIAVEKPVEKRKLPIEFSSADRGSQDVVDIRSLTLRVGEKTLLNNASAIIKNAERVAIIGENGCGKSTLIKEIMKNESPCLKVGKNLKIGYLSQIIEFLDPKMRVLNYFIDETGKEELYARSILFKFQFFKYDMIKRVGDLSGGEKLRLKLAIMLQNNYNFLIFDEPTNHIDIATREVLEESLDEYIGTILFVSHDRYFINKLATKVIEFNNQKLVTYSGNYEDYIAEKEKRS